MDKDEIIKELLLDFAEYMNGFSPSPNIEESEIDDYLEHRKKQLNGLNTNK